MSALVQYAAQDGEAGPGQADVVPAKAGDVAAGVLDLEFAGPVPEVVVGIPGVLGCGLREAGLVDEVLAVGKHSDRDRIVPEWDFLDVAEEGQRIDVCGDKVVRAEGRGIDQVVQGQVGPFDVERARHLAHVMYDVGRGAGRDGRDHRVPDRPLCLLQGRAVSGLLHKVFNDEVVELGPAGPFQAQQGKIEHFRHGHVVIG